MCFQNLLLGGPCDCGFRETFPLKVPFVFTSRRMCLWGGGVEMYLEEGKQTLLSVYCWTCSELNDTKYSCRWIKAAIFWWSTLSTHSSVSPQWKKSHPKLDYSKVEPYQRICPLGAPLNVLVGVAYHRKGCILHVLWHFNSTMFCF